MQDDAQELVGIPRYTVCPESGSPRATWCGGCQAIAPMLDQVAQEIGDKVKLFEVDVEKNQEIPAQFGIMAIPALLFFKDGKEVNRLGPTNKENVMGALEALQS